MLGDAMMGAAHLPEDESNSEYTCHMCKQVHERLGYCDSEAEGIELVMDIVRLARSEKPYKKEVELLKHYTEKYPKVQSLVNQLVENLK